MAISTQDATRLTARIAPYLDAIREAREVGLTWGDVARRLDISSPYALRKAVLRCRYVVEQVPLPPPKEPAPRSAPGSAAAVPANSETSETETERPPEAAPTADATPADTASPAPTPSRRLSAREALAAARQYNYPTRK